MSISVIDIEPLVTGRAPGAVAAAIGEACRTGGFFYIAGHGVDEDLQDRLERLSREFFAQDTATKMKIRMRHGGRAWRGYFPVGGELTSGQPDRKEGLYFGAELPSDDRPLHGPNLFPSPEFRETVLAYLTALTGVGHALMRGIALSLDLGHDYFAERYTADPLILFRIFNYPPGGDEAWGVGEHTDYGLLTILKQDDNGGLQVKSQDRWIAADPIPSTFVCNIGDMLDRLTGGHYRSTPHRVIGTRDRDRLSWPFFFDPNFDADVRAVGQRVLAPHTRWDGADVHDFEGTYGDYLLAKVSKVFPQLNDQVHDR
ncbi:isopenicillin N synthase family dioxygenase [Kibdelosporangium phytohabitans]|uniref:Iron oxidase n=1 Tax=Kibdelosporangium phytohabitans TaxID=860235 RepID=A0A0N9I9L0_9PSEU|nr:2-oxoglutarate and iron-dependent oxygenase domain-containing protein [Kibdelosporangium phytohabitans]ALG11330.1 iron oxidase [Kibdelosporangium phytohabitans]MBE1462638.1 isopenicillin N synthase-like dioxygenase [Kibdelosporangium phytohabitans]